MHVWASNSHEYIMHLMSSPPPPLCIWSLLFASARSRILDNIWCEVYWWWRNWLLSSQVTDTFFSENVNKLCSITQTHWRESVKKKIFEITDHTGSAKTNDTRSLTLNYSNLSKFRKFCEMMDGASLLLRKWWRKEDPNCLNTLPFVHFFGPINGTTRWDKRVALTEQMWTAWEFCICEPQ